MWSRLAAGRPSRLLLTWCAYWLALALWGLGPVLPTLWRITRPGVHGTVSASIDDGIARLAVVRDAATVWTGQIGVGELALWIGVPPLLLWALWLRARGAGRRPLRAADRVV